MCRRVGEKVSSLYVVSAFRCSTSRACSAAYLVKPRSHSLVQGSRRGCAGAEYTSPMIDFVRCCSNLFSSDTETDSGGRRRDHAAR